MEKAYKGREENQPKVSRQSQLLTACTNYCFWMPGMYKAHIVYHRKATQGRFWLTLYDEKLEAQSPFPKVAKAVGGSTRAWLGESDTVYTDGSALSLGPG